CQQYDNFPLTC
nr:immunoglobulin light chain junction region [Macaca mulatta]